MGGQAAVGGGKGGDVVHHQIQAPHPGPHTDAEGEAQRPPKTA